MAQSAQNPSSQQQKVIITNKYGNKLVGILHEAGTKEIVILCHGLQASKGLKLGVSTTFQLLTFSSKGRRRSKSDGSDSGEDSMSKKDLALKQALDQITSAFGKGSIMWLGRSDTPKDVPVVSTGSFALDIALGCGGLPKGRVVEIYGPEASGKTTLALHVIAEAQKQGGFEQKRVIIPNKHGEKLVGILHDSGTKEIVILCHGFRSSKESKTLVNLAAALEKAGISSFRFDFSGNGESDGLFQYGYYWREAEDLHAITQHFHKSNRLVTAIVGHSKGGGVVLLYASKYHDVKAVVNLSGRYDMKTGIEERLGNDYMKRIKEDGFIDVKSSGNSEYRVTLESLLDRLNTDMHEACLQIDKECRVLTVHGSSDTVISVGDASKFAQIIPNHTLHIIEGADHPYTNHQDELSSLVVNFIKETLHQNRDTSTSGSI